MNSPVFSYPNLNSSTLVYEPNISYLVHTNNISSIPDPMSGSTIGLMMLLSTFQYQSSYISATHSDAVNSAGKAAYIESGGQSYQDRFLSIITNKTKEVVYSIGITNAEMGAVLGTAKVIKDRGFSLTGPSIYSVKTNLTIDPNGANLGLKYEW